MIEFGLIYDFDLSVIFGPVAYVLSQFFKIVGEPVTTIIVALILFMVIFINFGLILRDFTLFSEWVAWVIAFVLCLILSFTGTFAMVVKLIVALWGYIFAVLIILVIAIIIMTIIVTLSKSRRKIKKKEEKIKIQAGKEILKSIAKTKK